MLTCACSAIGQRVPGYAADEMIHIDLATDIVKALFNNDLESKKRFFLNYLYNI